MRLDRAAFVEPYISLQSFHAGSCSASDCFCCGTLQTCDLLVLLLYVSPDVVLFTVERCTNALRRQSLAAARTLQSGRANIVGADQRVTDARTHNLRQQNLRGDAKETHTCTTAQKCRAAFSTPKRTFPNVCVNAGMPLPNSEYVLRASAPDQTSKSYHAQKQRTLGHPRLDQARLAGSQVCFFRLATLS